MGRPTSLEALMPLPRTATLAAAGAALALGGLTACSAGGADTTTASSSPSPNAQQVAALYRQFAQCLRENGAPTFPEFVRDPRTGDWAPPRGTKDPPQRAFSACRSISGRYRVSVPLARLVSLQPVPPLPARSAARPRDSAA